LDEQEGDEVPATLPTSAWSVDRGIVPRDAAPASTSADAGSIVLGTASDEQAANCPSCDQPSLRLVSVIAKPSWDKLLNHLHEDCPAWYAETDLEEFSRYLMDAYGIEYADWHAQCAVESTMKHPTPPPRPLTPRHHQLFLPGLHPQHDLTVSMTRRSRQSLTHVQSVSQAF